MRHLCSVYWQTDIQRRLAEQSDEMPALGDLQVRVLSHRGPVTCDAVAQQSDRLESEEPLVILAYGGQHSLEEGAVLRIVDARLLTTNPDESDNAPGLPIVSLTSAREVYVLP